MNMSNITNNDIAIAAVTRSFVAMKCPSNISFSFTFSFDKNL